MLDRTMLRDQIKDLIIQRILDGTYAPGERIVEMTLAAELGTSQAPVREAMRDLEAMRFIDSIPYRGARVRHVTTEELSETYPVRASLEELAGSLAATRVDDDLIEALSAELDAMRECARAGELHAQLSHDARFHELIVEAAGNSVLLESWRGLRIEASDAGLGDQVRLEPPRDRRHPPGDPGGAAAAGPGAGREGAARPHREVRLLPDRRLTGTRRRPADSLGIKPLTHPPRSTPSADASLRVTSSVEPTPTTSTSMPRSR